MSIENFVEMEHLLRICKCSILHNVFQEIDESPTKRLTNQLSPFINVILVMTEVTSSAIFSDIWAGFFC